MTRYRVGQIHAFRVMGKGSFPLDMLRHDSCWPRGQNDVGVIQESLDERTRIDRTVELSTGSSASPTEGRWESFGWRVM